MYYYMNFKNTLNLKIESVKSQNILDIKCTYEEIICFRRQQILSNKFSIIFKKKNAAIKASTTSHNKFWFAVVVVVCWCYAMMLDV